MFQAAGGGGWAILQHSNVAKGSPADPSGAAILPFSGSPWDGAHFCAEDWHAILAADIEGGDSSYKHNDAERIMREVTMDFTLDGTALPTTRTAINRYLNPEDWGFQAAHYFQQGRIMSPADLSIGSHRLELTMSHPVDGPFQDAITFFVDAPGTGACT